MTTKGIAAADKAHATRTRRLAGTLGIALEAMQAAGKTEADVVSLFAAHSESPVRKCDAFWVLDNDHRRGGHMLLRRTRNHPVHGVALFALFR